MYLKGGLLGKNPTHVIH